MLHAVNSTLTPEYSKQYANFASHLGFVVKAISEEAGSTVNSTAINSGQQGLQALLDAVMDSGHRAVLIHALNSPAITGWVREQMENFLYGQNKQSLPVLFKRTVH